MISSHLTQKTWLHLIPTSVKLFLLSSITYSSIFITSLSNAVIMLSMSFLIYLSLGRQARGKLIDLIKSFGTLVFLIAILQCVFIPISFVALIICPISISPWAAFGSAIRNLVKNNKIKAVIEYFLAILLLITAIIIVLQ